MRLLFLLLLTPLLISLMANATTVTFILHGQGGLVVITSNGDIFNVNKTETFDVPQGVQINVLSTQYFSVNGSPPVTQYSFYATNNTVLNITFVSINTTTSSAQSNIRTVAGIIVSIIGLAFLYYLYRKSKEEE